MLFNGLKIYLSYISCFKLISSTLFFWVGGNILISLLELMGSKPIIG